MTAIRLTALTTCALISCCCYAQSPLLDDDPEVTITNLADSTVGFRYVWAVRRSSLSALPRWDPLGGEVPLSPHDAVVKATEFVRNRFPVSAKVSVLSISLSLAGAGRGYDRPPLQGIWAYQINFRYDQATAAEKALLNVMVLLDGRVVIPVVTPLK
jgi:hypothetical protein